MTDRHTEVKAVVSPKGFIGLTVPFPSLKYINRFIDSKASVDLLKLKVFPNAKEITESFAVFRACYKKLNHSRGNDKIVALVVGDGGTPRTACTIAFFSKWTAVSIDPLAKWEDSKGVDRLSVVKALGEEYDYTDDVKDKHAIIVACHSHAPLSKVAERVMEANPLSLDIVSMSCCLLDHLGEPDFEYEDWGVHSAHFTIRGYRNVQ